jgi:O-antigen ligase
MAVTNFDICNRALVLLGVRKLITSFTQDSLEAQTANLSFTPVMNWCFGLANWNFARTTAALTISKGPPTVGPGAWSGAQPTPPWLYEYATPADYIRAVYITNNAVAPGTGVAGWAGEPQRFAIANDTGAVVLLTNQATCNLIYTAYITNPTDWPFYFERLAVIALANTMCLAITSDLNLQERLAVSLEQQISIAMQLNKLEGLVIEDSTPEWIQATGINYPYRRVDRQQEKDAAGVYVTNNMVPPNSAPKPRGR